MGNFLFLKNLGPVHGKHNKLGVPKYAKLTTSFGFTVISEEKISAEGPSQESVNLAMLSQDISLKCGHHCDSRRLMGSTMW